MKNKPCTTLVLACFAVGAGCQLDSGLKVSCMTSADCDSGNVCDQGACVSTTAAGSNGNGAIAASSGALVPTQIMPFECSSPIEVDTPNVAYAAALTGTWLRCDASQPFGDTNEAGIEFTEDGEFFVLEEHAGGLATRTTDPAYLGSYTEVDDSEDGPTGTLTLTPESGPTQVYRITANSTPPRVQLRAGTATSLFASVPLARPAACTNPTSGALLASTKNAQSFWAEAAGRWAFCDGYSDTGSVGGIELIPNSASSEDGVYYVLRPDASGTALVRSTALADTGQLSLDFCDSSGGINPLGPYLFISFTSGTGGSYVLLWSGSNEMVFTDEANPIFVRIQ